MKLLLCDRFAPITSEFGFIEKDAAAFAEWFREWDGNNVRGRGVVDENRPVAGSIEQLLQTLEPLTTVERRRYLFVSTQGAWTAYFDSGCAGGDAVVLALAARELKTRAARVVAVPDSRQGVASAGGRFGSTVFELYGPELVPEGFLNYQRTVSVVNDGGRWRFDQSGAFWLSRSPLCSRRGGSRIVSASSISRDTSDISALMHSTPRLCAGWHARGEARPARAEHARMLP